MSFNALKRKLKTLSIITVGGTASFAAINVYKSDDRFYRQFIMPLAHLLNPELAHRIGVFLSKYRLIPKSQYEDPELLKTKFFGKDISNPIGVAAGFDKNGEAMLGLQDLGFGFVEIGSVTPEPQPGNARPRVFRLKRDRAIINRYGFNSDGHEAVAERVRSLRSRNDFKSALGINIGKNKDSSDPYEDYVKGIEKFGPLADYIVINISSPNTPRLCIMQNKSMLKILLKNVNVAMEKLADPKPLLFLKLSPDLTLHQRLDVAEIVTDPEFKVDGLVICNTTTFRSDMLKSGDREELGGLSGDPLKKVSTQMISEMYALTNGMPIIGVGGVASGQDAYDKIRAGATVVQIYTAFTYEGPPIVARIKQELTELLEKDKYESIAEAVGVDVRDA